MKINFDGGDLSSDAGLLLIKEFACKLGFDKILKSEFKTNDSAMFRIHKDNQNLWQMVYQILGAYFEDDCADELTNDPVLKAILGKQALASQPTFPAFSTVWMNNSGVVLYYKKDSFLSRLNKHFSRRKHFHAFQNRFIQAF